jgi:Raf kinase inhibitor-like YbhB/YbcL family protein
MKTRLRNLRCRTAGDEPSRTRKIPIQIHARAFGLGLVLVLGGMAGCRSSATAEEGKPKLELASSSFQEGAIPKQFTCDGSDASPELSWSQPPSGTRSFALIAVDRDSAFSSFTHWFFPHWILYDLPPEARELPEALPKQEKLADGSRQGLNGFDKLGYVGPCPPGHSTHRYAFMLYALDSKLELPAGATRKQVEKALKKHILAQGELVGRYQH